MSNFVDSTLSLVEHYHNKHPEYRKGQAVFNYIEETYGNVARKVQFEDNVDCFYNDEQIVPFLNKVKERLGPNLNYNQAVYFDSSYNL